jgi:hypothetical protein
VWCDDGGGGVTLRRHRLQQQQQQQHTQHGVRGHARVHINVNKAIGKLFSLHTMGKKGVTLA